jgi:hypothetical protein
LQLGHLFDMDAGTTAFPAIFAEPLALAVKI